MEAATGGSQHSVEARRLLRRAQHAALATNFDGRPYVSLVAVACDSDASPLLLLSDLAQHTKNLLADPLVSLLFEGTEGYADPLAGPRLTLLGRAGRCDDGAAGAVPQIREHELIESGRTQARSGWERHHVPGEI